MTKHLEKRLSLILKSTVTPLLCSLNFKNKRLTYLKDVDALKWIVQIQKSRWNGNNEAQFTVNCGVYVPGVVSIYSNLPEPATPSMEHCSCSARVGMLMSPQRDVWWKLAETDSVEHDRTVADDLSSKIETIVLPFLAGFDSHLGVANFLALDVPEAFRRVFPVTRAQRLAYASIIRARAGNIDDANRLLDLAILAARKTPIEGVVASLRGKLEGMFAHNS